MARSTYNDHAPGALGLEVLGVGTSSYSFPATLRQRGLVFTAQRTGTVDRLQLHSGPGTNCPTFSTLFPGRRFPYVAELIPLADLDTGGPHTITTLTSSIVSQSNAAHEPGGGPAQAGDLANHDGVSVRASANPMSCVCHFPTADSFPLDQQVIAVAVEHSEFATNLRARRRGDLNVSTASDTVLWSRVLAGSLSQDNWHMGELWVEGGGTGAWVEVTPTMIRQFDSAVGNRRMELQSVSFNLNFTYNLFRLHVDHVPERRVGTGVIEVAAGAVANQRDVLVDIPFHAPGATGTPVSLVAGTEYVLVIRSPYSGSNDYSGSSNFDLRAVSDQRDAGGAFVHFEGLDWDWHDLSGYDAGGGTQSGTQPPGALLAGLPTAVLSVTGSPTVDSVPYRRTVGGRVSTQPGEEELRQRNVVNPTPAQEFRSCRLNLSLGQTAAGEAGVVPTQPLQVSFTSPGGSVPLLGPFSVAPEDVLALGSTLNTDEFGHQYFPVTVDFQAGFTLPASFDVVVTSSTAGTRPWRAAVLLANVPTVTGSPDQTYLDATSFATGRYLDPVGSVLRDLNVNNRSDLEFTLFTQAPEVTGLDVSVLQREAHGATCQSDLTAPTPTSLTETFNKADGPLGPDLEWNREVYTHEFVQVVAAQRARFRVDEPGSWEDVQVPTPNTTRPDVRVQLTVTSIASTGSPVTGVDDYQASAGVLTRALLTEEGDDYRGYAAVVGRDRFVASPTEQWHLDLYRVDGREDQVLLARTTLPLASVTLPGTLTLTSVGTTHTARFTHAGSGAALEVQARDDTYRGGTVFLRPRVVHVLDGRVDQLEYDDLVLTELDTGVCTTCRQPRVTYARLCWAPTQLAPDDFTHFEVQRSENGGPFETVALLPKLDLSTTVTAAALSSTSSSTSHPAPSLAAVGEELLVCWWHAGTTGDYSVSGTGMNPLGTALQLPFAPGSGASTPDRSELHSSVFDVRVKLSMTDWTPGGFGLFLVGQLANVAGRNGWGLGIQPAGQLAFSYSSNGTSIINRVSTVATGITDGRVGYLRATFVGDNGAGQHVVQFFTSPDGVTWNQLGSTVTTAGTVTIFNTSEDLRIGDILPVAATAAVQWVEVRTQVDGPVVARAELHSQLPGTSTFEDEYDNTWTVYGTASIVDANEWSGTFGGGADTTSVATWEQVQAGSTGTRTATFTPSETRAAVSVLVRGREGPPVLEEVVTNLGLDGVTLTTSPATRRGQWLLAVLGSEAGSNADFGPPTPGNWQLVVDSGESNAADKPRVAAWVRAVVDDGPQVVTVPQTTDPFDPWDYHLRVAVLSDVAEFIPSCYDDWSVRYGQEACYQVRQGRSDGSVSDYSVPVCATVPPPAGVDLVFTVPERPELNAAYNEAHTRLPTERDYEHLDANDSVYVGVYGRDKQLKFRPMERRGLRFQRQLLVSPMCEDHAPCLEVVQPLVDLMVEPITVVVVRDDCGNRWFAGVEVDTTTQLATVGLPDLWTAAVTITELADPLIAEGLPVEAHSELA